MDMYPREASENAESQLCHVASPCEDNYFQRNRIPAERMFFLLVIISHTPAGKS